MTSTAAIVHLPPLVPGALVGVHLQPGPNLDQLLDLASLVHVHTTGRHSVSVAVAVVESVEEVRSAARQAAKEGIPGLLTDPWVDQTS
jgi:hypothetical protein